MRLRLGPVVLAAVLAVGCVGVPAALAAAGIQQVSPDPGCPIEFPERLIPRAYSGEEVKYLDATTACTDWLGQSTWVQNRSDVVVRFTADGFVRPFVIQQDFDWRFVNFRNDASLVTDADLLLPDTTVVLLHPPHIVHWDVDPWLSVMWLTHDELTDLVVEQSQDHLVELAAGSPRRAAVFRCAFEAWNARQTLGDFFDSSDRFDQLVSAVGLVAGASACGDAWRTADDIARQQGLRTATWTDDVLRLAGEPQFWARADDALGFLNLARKVVTIFVPG